MPWKLEITTFDVGQGDSSFIKTWNEDTKECKTVLIDGGQKKYASNILKNLKNLCKDTSGNIIPVDRIIITHFDKDHAGGIVDLLRWAILSSSCHELKGYLKEELEKIKEIEKIKDLSVNLLKEAITRTFPDLNFKGLDKSDQNKNKRIREYLLTEMNRQKVHQLQQFYKTIDETIFGLFERKDHHTGTLFETTKIYSLELETTSYSGGDEMRRQLNIISKEKKVEFNSYKFYSKNFKSFIQEKLLNLDVLWNSGAVPAGTPTMKIIAANGTAASDKVNDNNLSIAILLTLNNFRYYSGGDLESIVEDKVVKQTLSAFKCSHHGSDLSTSENFLKKSKPKVAIVSAGIPFDDNGEEIPDTADSDPNHRLPNKNAMERLKNSPDVQMVYLTGCANPDLNDMIINKDQVKALGHKFRVAGAKWEKGVTKDGKSYAAANYPGDIILRYSGGQVFTIEYAEAEDVDPNNNTIRVVNKSLITTYQVQ